MKIRPTMAGAVLLGLTGLSVSISAHHGPAAFDLAHATTLNAIVTSFDWFNPHALIGFAVKSENGTVANWTAETAGLVILARAGWTRSALKEGDHVTIIGHRAKNQTNTMLLQRVVLANGRELTNFVPK